MKEFRDYLEEAKMYRVAPTSASQFLKLLQNGGSSSTAKLIAQKLIRIAHLKDTEAKWFEEEAGEKLFSSDIPDKKLKLEDVTPEDVKWAKSIFSKIPKDSLVFKNPNFKKSFKDFFDYVPSGI